MPNSYITWEQLGLWPSTVELNLNLTRRLNQLSSDGRAEDELNSIELHTMIVRFLNTTQGSSTVSVTGKLYYTLSNVVGLSDSF